MLRVKEHLHQFLFKNKVLKVETLIHHIKNIKRFGYIHYIDSDLNRQIHNVFISVNNCTGKFLGNVDLYRKLIPKKFMADETPALTMFLY